MSARGCLCTGFFSSSLAVAGLIEECRFAFDLCFRPLPIRGEMRINFWSVIARADRTASMIFSLSITFSLYFGLCAICLGTFFSSGSTKFLTLIMFG
jgi:hypothetical protein